MRFLAIGMAVLALLASGTIPRAHAASVPAVNPQQCEMPQACNDLNAYNYSVNQNVSGFQPLNFLDNGAMLINQRGAAERVGGTTSGPTPAQYGADRWAVDVNVTSGAGYSNEVTSESGVTFAPGFPKMMKVYRKTGALTQPVCAEQEIESARFTTLQGRSVILSAFIAADAAFPAAGVVTGYLITGTGTDQGLGVPGSLGMTASPALTPAWTGIATAAVTLAASPNSTATRYASGPIAVPVAATEGAVLLCFTPGAETAGTTDGFLFTGAQLEEADVNQATAGRFERPAMAEAWARALRFYWQLAEPAAGVLVAQCNAITTGYAVCTLPTPVPMISAPTLVFSTQTTSTWELFDGSATPITLSGATSLIQNAFGANTVNAIGLKATGAATPFTAGHGVALAGAGGGANMQASSDF
jgi:hypothetical protein